MRVYCSAYNVSIYAALARIGVWLFLPVSCSFEKNADKMQTKKAENPDFARVLG